MEIGFFVLVGIGIAVYLYRYADSAETKEAAREASHMDLQQIEYQLEKFDQELKEIGVLSKQDRALMAAIHSKRSDLLRIQRNS